MQKYRFVYVLRTPDSEGTLISASDGATKGRDVEERPVTGIAHVSNVTQIKVLTKETAYDLQQHVFKEMANEGNQCRFN